MLFFLRGYNAVAPIVSVTSGGSHMLRSSVSCVFPAMLRDNILYKEVVRCLWLKTSSGELLPF